MKEEKSNFTNDKFIIENNFYFIGLPDDTEKFTDEMSVNDTTHELERKSYQDYLKNETTEKISLQDIDYKNLEKVFTKKADYLAMKKLTEFEKFTIYIYAFFPQYIERLCKDCNVPVEYFTTTMKNGVRKFMKYQKIYSNKFNNCNNKKKCKNIKKYYKKGGVSNV